MTSPPRSPREEERRSNLRTLVIASVASATAALVTSRLWIAGTWIAAALTPVLVTLLSELLRRPTERIARGLTSEREALPDPEAPARRVAERLRAVDELVPDPEAQVRVYRSEGTSRKRRIAFRAVFATAAIAFAIAAVALTVPELIAGSSFGKSDRRTTLLGGSTGSKSATKDKQPTDTTPSQTDTTQTTTTTTTSTTTTTPTTPPGEPTDTTATTTTTTSTTP
jgi:hypothetical protein